MSIWFWDWLYLGWLFNILSIIIAVRIYVFLIFLWGLFRLNWFCFTRIIEIIWVLYVLIFWFWSPKYNDYKLLVIFLIFKFIFFWFLMLIFWGHWFFFLLIMHWLDPFFIGIFFNIGRVIISFDWYFMFIL